MKKLILGIAMFFGGIVIAMYSIVAQAIIVAGYNANSTHRLVMDLFGNDLSNFAVFLIIGAVLAVVGLVYSIMAISENKTK